MSHEPTRFWTSRFAVGLVVMGAVAAYFVLSEHRASSARCPSCCCWPAR